MTTERIAFVITTFLKLLICLQSYISNKPYKKYGTPHIFYMVRHNIREDSSFPLKIYVINERCLQNNWFCYLRYLLLCYLVEQNPFFFSFGNLIILNKQMSKFAYLLF